MGLYGSNVLNVIIIPEPLNYVNTILFVALSNWSDVSGKNRINYILT